LDSLTHTVLGACVGEAIAGKKLGKQAMLWGAIANNIPDIDVVTSFYMGQVDSLIAHRGFTHSFLFCLLFPAILSFLFARWYKNRKMHFREWYILFASGTIIHILIDALTCYGTGWYEPFDHSRISFNLLFVADPFYTLPLLVSFFVLVAVHIKHKTRKGWIRFGLISSSIYILYAFINKMSIDRDFRHTLNDQKIEYVNYFTTPTPLNNFLWMLVAKSDSGYYIGYRSVFDKSAKINLHYKSQNEDLLATLPEDKDLVNLKRFAMYYYTIDKNNDSLYFSDIRFGSVLGWNNPDADFVFRYGLDKNANNDLVIQKGRLKTSGGEAFSSLYERIFNEPRQQQFE
jgi:inner membrane protein